MPVYVRTTPYVCLRCGRESIHTEAWEGDDEAHGLALEDAWCAACGGWLVRLRGEDARNVEHASNLPSRRA